LSRDNPVKDLMLRPIHEPEVAMKKFLILVLLLSNYALSGCVESTLVVGQPGAAIKSEEVVVYFVERPSCNFETIAHINVSGGYFSLESIVGGMRQQAASVGADGLYVLQTQQLAIKEYLGTARAIRCLPA
jgi:hypothetical protein